MVPWMLSLLSSLATCDAVSGAAPFIRPGAVVLLGEIHGTEESPVAVSKLACLALERGLSVTVGLEIPVAESERVAAFMAGGEAADLLSGTFWARDYQDGRASAAMLALLTRLRELAGEEGSSLDVVLIDDPEAPRGRDRFMAARVVERAGIAPDGIVIALVGNLHNRLTRGTRFDSEYEPMGLFVRDALAEREVVSLRITHGGGSAWICTGGGVSSCGVRDLNGREGTPGIELEVEASNEPYTGRYHVPHIEASPPARNASETP